MDSVLALGLIQTLGFALGSPDRILVRVPAWKESMDEGRSDVECHTVKFRMCSRTTKKKKKGLLLFIFGSNGMTFSNI